MLLAVATLYGASEWRLSRTYEVPQLTLHPRERPPSLERGEHLSAVFGCRGCHGEAGRILFDRPFFARVIAPNLSRVAADYSDEELLVLIRAGIKRDRTSAIAMPFDSFAWMADEDVADVIAWLRSLTPKTDAETRANSFGPLARIAMISGRFPFGADQPADAEPPVVQPALGTTAHGRYLTNVMCLHCHRLNEEHLVRPGLIAPSLAPAATGYDAEQFKRLMRTGIPIGERKLELMSEVSTGSLTFLTDEEIASLYNYLTTTASAPQ